MTSKIKQTAKQLFKLSIVDGVVNEKRVREIIQTLVSRKPLHYVKILETYKNLIENFLSAQEMVIEVPKGFDTKDMALKTNKKIVVKEDLSIVFGLRVIDGDWVYDNTLRAKLENIVGNI